MAFDSDPNGASNGAYLVHNTLKSKVKRHAGENRLRHSIAVFRKWLELAKKLENSLIPSFLRRQESIQIQ